MANSADPINHDGLSTAATIGGKVVKYGAIGLFAVPAIGAVIGVVATVVGAAVFGATIGGGALLAAALVGALLTTGTAAVLGATGVVTGGFLGAAFGLTALGGGVLGAFKGADQVSRETNAFRAKVTERMNGRENQDVSKYNKGYNDAMMQAPEVLEPVIQQREQAAMQKGAEMVVAQIQEHMQAEMAAAAANAPPGVAKPGPFAPATAKPDANAHHNKHATAKPPVTIGSKVISSCECPDGTKAAAIAEQQVKSQEPGQLTPT